jgi:formylglycine-generating enzyme
MHRLVGLAALLVALPAGAVTMDWVYVGDPGNAPDTATNCLPVHEGSLDCGSVSYAYYISKYEVTNVQYAEFLNAKAKSDPLGLYDTLMDVEALGGGITRSGSAGSYTYAAKAGFANKPVVWVSLADALRFSNWLNNGQGSGDTETGAYTLLGGTATPSNLATVTRNPGALTFLPSENEWYKAAYYSPAGVYFDYPTGTNTATGCVVPSSDSGNSANCHGVVSVEGGLTNVGAYSLSESPYGTFDQGGNVMEWNEWSPSPGTSPGARGGAFATDYILLAASSPNDASPGSESFIGFRVASLVPEPGTGVLTMTGLLGLAARRKRRA